MRRKLRTLLILGRVSNVPTVWSNCLAGWLLGGGGSARGLFWLSFGASLSYIGGMFLNDAFDADFDRQHRHSRPIPSGAASEREVWRWGFGLLVASLVCLSFFNWKTTALSFAMAGLIVLYDGVHGSVPFAPVLMALCRFILILVAASTGSHGVDAAALWSAAALGLYITGLSYIARGEDGGGIPRYWATCLLGSPMAIALVADRWGSPVRTILFSVVLVAWVLRSLRYCLWSEPRRIGRAVSGLLAGIVFVDLVAVAGVSASTAAVFVCFFAAALLLQRYVPAT